VRVQVLLPIVLLLLAISVYGVPTLSTSNHATILPGDVSWNRFAECRPTILTLEQVLGNQTNSQGGALESGGWQGVIPNKRATSPPCVVNGLPTLVEIRHLHTSFGTPGTSWDECSAVLAGDCDLTLNLGDNPTLPCPACYMHKIHVEIDMYWNASRTAPMMIPVGTWVDVQGFVYWDPDHVTSQGHSYSGWELHPFTAWRISGTTNTTVPLGVTICPGTVRPVSGGVSQCSTTPTFTRYY
jgi:hypothetical protein